jgi:hypothetical protein
VHLNESDTVDDKLSKFQWVEALARSFARTMPDMYPSSFAEFYAEELGKNGDYEKYLNGDYGDLLWKRKDD